MTEREPLYKLIDGEPMLSTACVALLMDLPEDVLSAEMERQGCGGDPGTFRMPAAWAKRGVRVRKETQAALGYEAGLKEVIDYLAEKAGL